MISRTRRQFIIYFFFVGWENISLGITVCLSFPNIELHIPFGFIRIGWVSKTTKPINATIIDRHIFGLAERYYKEDENGTDRTS